MSFYKNMRAAIETNDMAAYENLMDDSFVFVRHKDGSQLSKAEAAELIRGMVESGQWNTHDERCLYENEDICVAHTKMTFPDGSREAVMSVYSLKDGKAVRLETGATTL